MDYVEVQTPLPSLTSMHVDVGEPSPPIYTLEGSSESDSELTELESIVDNI